MFNVVTDFFDEEMPEKSSLSLPFGLLLLSCAVGEETGVKGEKNTRTMAGVRGEVRLIF